MIKIDLPKDYLTFDFLFEQIEELFLSLISGSRKKNHFFVLCLKYFLLNLMSAVPVEVRSKILLLIKPTQGNSLILFANP